MSSETLRKRWYFLPVFTASEKETRRWSREYRSRLIREDLQDLERVKDIGLMENLAIRLPDLVGSPLSVNALRKDLQVSHKTASRRLTIFENLYLIFRIYPFGASIRVRKSEILIDYHSVPSEKMPFETDQAPDRWNVCIGTDDFQSTQWPLLITDNVYDPGCRIASRPHILGAYLAPETVALRKSVKGSIS